MPTGVRAGFRELLDRDEVVLAPVVHSALVAQVTNKLGGFDLLGISGYGASVNTLGMPDAGYLTMSETVRLSRYVAETADVPVYADADTGFGNAVTARRTAREFIEYTDVAGLFVEDQVSPKRCGHVSGKRVLPMAEAVGKVRAVCDVRDDLDPEFVVIARTDARGAAGGSLDEAIARGNAYREAGADVIFVEGPTTEAEVARIGREVDAPLKYNQTGVSPFLDAETLAGYGFSISSVTTTRAAVVALYDHLRGLRDEGIDFEAAFREGIADHPAGDLHKFSDMGDVRDLEREYLPETEQEKYATSIGHDGEGYRTEYGTDGAGTDADAGADADDEGGA